MIYDSTSEEKACRALGPERFDAVLFDMDGVLTTTRRMHALAWKRTFGQPPAAPIRLER